MKYRQLYAIGLLTLIAACQAKGRKAESESNEKQTMVEEIITDSCTIDGTTYRIYQRDTLAFIRAQGERDTVYGQLQLRAPVYIVRAHQSDQVLDFAYPQFKVDKILMLFGGKQDPAQQQEHGVDTAKWCGSHIQGLIINKDRSILTDEAQEGMKCKGGSSDEKDFYGLAEGNR